MCENPDNIETSSYAPEGKQMTVVGAGWQVDKGRIAELSAKEEKRLNDSTPGSGRMYDRAKKTMAGGVPSSYQVRDPWPIYLEEGKGSKVWDVDGNERIDYHNGFGSMVQGHAHPAIIKAVSDRVAKGTHFAAPI